MKIFKNFTTQMILALCAFCACINTAEALYEGPTQVGVDGTDQTVLVWQTFDSVTGRYRVEGAYGNGPSWTVSHLSDVTNFNVKAFPLLTVSSSSTNTRAAAAWIATDAFNRRIIQVAILDNLGNWIPSAALTFPYPTGVSNNDGSETPRDDFLLDISDDGLIIAVTWKTTTPSLINRVAISTNGGTTWNTYTLSTVL